MNEPATWSDKVHEQSEVTVSLPVSEAMHLRAIFPRLLEALEKQGVRGPDDRAQQRDARAALASFSARLSESLRPYAVPGVFAGSPPGEEA